jgi:signal transduction histidine kinase
MEDLINGVLAYSKVGRTEIKNEKIDLIESLKHICETIIPKKGFKYKIDEKMPTFMGPKILIEQVFSNLISNAVKYNNKGVGEIEIIYGNIPGFHKFSIKDNGPGVPKEYQEKIFQIFQTIEARDVKESTGIGLSIVQKIIEEQGGEIWIESVENEGSSFVFTLPKRAENE